ncbi:MAG TPA: molybdopterin dinucleotide binding domain-containing protein, partial [Pyrinomonadaceae bacterium]|nr:molybdopterin dinucleotide binding domain-containing protein [Pyrinomonadaceae bacterium]
LERGHYDIAFHLLAVRNVTKFSPPLFAPAPNAKHDWQILLELQTRMSDDGFAGRVKASLAKRLLGPERLLDLGLRFGPYGARLNPFSSGLTLRKVRNAKHGIDLGPMSPCLPGRLRTTDKQIDVAPEAFVHDVARVKTRLLDQPAPNVNGHLRLIGRRQLRSNNSWMHNTERLLRGKPQCTMLMHPDDAANRDLRSGQDVLVKSNVGSVKIPIEVSDEMMPGVVSIPHGWGHDRQGIQLEVAQQHPGTSINDLTDSLDIDALCGTAAFNGTWVTVEAAG